MTTQPQTETPNRTNLAAGTSAARQIAEVQNRLRNKGARHIGDVIGWNTEDIDVERVLAKGVFEKVGMGKLIPDMDPETALNRAVKEARFTKGEGLVALPFKKPNKDTPKAWGIYEFQVQEGEKGDKPILGARIRLENGVAMVREPEENDPILVCMERAIKIAEHANHLITHAETRDVSNALSATVAALSGVPLRKRGGLYLLPPGTCETWDVLVPGLTELGVDPLVLPMYDEPKVMQQAGKAARGALESDLKELVADLEKAQTSGMRGDSLERRVAACESLIARAGLFQDVLQDMAGAIGEKAKELKASFAKVAAGTKDPDADLFTLNTAAA